MKTTAATRTKVAAIVAALAGLVLVLTACSAASSGSASATDAATSVETAAPVIEDGTYAGVDLTEHRNERAVVVVLKGTSATYTFSDCWNGVNTLNGTRSGDQISWSNGTKYPSEILDRIATDGTVGFVLAGPDIVSQIPDLMPDTFPGVADDLAEFNQRCDKPIPKM